MSGSSRSPLVYPPEFIEAAQRMYPNDLRLGRMLGINSGVPVGDILWQHTDEIADQSEAHPDLVLARLSLYAEWSRIFIAWQKE